MLQGDERGLKRPYLRSLLIRAPGPLGFSFQWLLSLVEVMGGICKLNLNRSGVLSSSWDFCGQTSGFTELNYSYFTETGVSLSARTTSI